jgi:hypothetical protein
MINWTIGNAREKNEEMLKLFSFAFFAISCG